MKAFRGLKFKLTAMGFIGFQLIAALPVCNEFATECPRYQFMASVAKLIDFAVVGWAVGVIIFLVFLVRMRRINEAACNTDLGIPFILKLRREAVDRVRGSGSILGGGYKVI